MNTLVRWHNRHRQNPLANSMTNSLVNASVPVDDLFATFFRPAASGAPEIRLDVNEDKHAYRVSATLAGVKKEDIQLAVNNNEVTIEVEFKRDSGVVDDEKSIHRERFYGKTSRAFAVAEDIDEANIDAKYVDGVLHLTLPKKAPVSAKRITIN